MATKRLFLLHDGVIIHIVIEWHYGEHTPTLYYLYLPNSRSAIYKHFYTGKKFEHYQKVSK